MKNIFSYSFTSVLLVKVSFQRPQIFLSLLFYRKNGQSKIYHNLHFLMIRKCHGISWESWKFNEVEFFQKTIYCKVLHLWWLQGCWHRFKLLFVIFSLTTSLFWTTSFRNFRTYQYKIAYLYKLRHQI